MPINPRLAAVLWYAKHSWKVFAAHTPTAKGCSCSKKKHCPDIGKHPRWHKTLLPHGVTSATTDEALIKTWWRQWPDANIGIATGVESGIFVLDVDARHDGIISRTSLETTHGPLPPTVERVSGDGGGHLVFAHPGAAVRIKNSDSKLAPGLDIRGDGGYIIVPPSLHVSGQQYKWKEGYSPKDLPPATAPEWLLTLIINASRRQNVQPPDAPIPEGQRNSTLFANGCAMRRRGLSYDAILAALRVENEQRCNPPLADEDLQKIADSAAKYDPALAADEPTAHGPTFDDILASAKEVLTQLQETHDVRLLYKALSTLCLLPADEWGPWKAEYKAVLGDQLNLRDLDRAYKEAKARQQHAQRLQQKPARPVASHRIRINDRQLPAITDDALQAVLAHYARTPTQPVMYVQSGTLQRIVADEDGHEVIELLTEAPLRGILARVADWYSAHGQGDLVMDADEFPPPDVVKDVLHLGNWPNIPALHGIVRAPVFAADGTLHQSPGYNPVTKLYQTSTIRLGDTIPTSSNVAGAKELLLNTWWGDFPFRDDASKAHALAVVITSFVREMIEGQIPLTVYDSPAPGTGKGLLADICAMPATGYPLPTMTAGRDPDEWRKRITAALIRGGAFIGIDNITGPLDSGDLASALTQPIWEDRVLGLSRMVTIPIRTIWLATGNNITPSEEIARRSVWIRPDAEVEKPWEREGFKIEKLRAWTLEHRAELVTAVITLVQAWIERQKPVFTVRRKGSYEAWAEVVGGILEVAGIPGFLENETQFFNTTVTATSLLSDFVKEWWAAYDKQAVGTDKLFALASHSDNPDADDETVWKNLLGELLGSGNQRSRQIKLGKLLNGYSDKVISGYKIEKDTVVRGVPRYHLKDPRSSGGAASLSTHGSGHAGTVKATETSKKIDEAHDNGGECGERGECSDDPHARVRDNGAGESNLISIEQGVTQSPLSPHSPPGFPSILRTEAIQIKVDQQRYHLPAMVVIATPSQLDAALPILIAAPTLALDTETTGLDPLTDDVRLVQFFLPDCVYVIDLATIPVAQLIPIFRTQKRWIGHNLKFDLKFLMASHVPPLTGELVDTMLCSQLLYAGTPEGTLSKSGLAVVVARELGVTLEKALQTSDWSQALRPEQLHYAARDVSVLWPLADALMTKLEGAGLAHVAQLEGACTPALALMELNGLPIDAVQWQAMTAAEERRLVEVSSAMAALLHGQGRNLSGDCTVNWDSHKQILALLQARGHAIETTDATTLRLLRTADPLIPLLLEYREASKRISTYGEAWLRKLHPVTGRLHPDYLQLGSQAGRMSCQRPNVQQVPRESQYRRAIRAPEGQVLIKADYSQIELRIAAMMAEDETMLQAFQAGKDLHVVTGAAVMKVPESEVTAAHRQISKSLNFGLLYGMGVDRLRAYAESTYGVALTEDEAARHRGQFFATYTGLRRWHQQTGDQLKRASSVDTRTLAGRRRLQVDKFTELLNTPVQGSGADGLKGALGRLFQHRADAPTAKLVAAVHDEIVVECPVQQADATAAWVITHMQAAMEQIVKGSVPIVVETNIGQTWAG
jgi:DNA polymerase I